MAKRRKSFGGVSATYRRGKRVKVTVAVMVHGVERKYRGATLRSALKAAEADVIPKSKWGGKRPCHVKWFSRTKGGSVVKRNSTRGRGSILLDGALLCEEMPVYATVYRPHTGKPWYKR